MTLALERMAMSPGKHLPKLFKAGPPARRESRVAARRPALPVHPAGKLTFTDAPGREYWWDLISEAVRRRIEQKVG